MTTSKGPWSYDAESGYVTTKDTTGAWVRGEVPGLVIAEVVSLDGISNGDLIAAAPEMRDALRLFFRSEQEMEDSEESAGMRTYAEFITAARAALAKAER